jgi:phosphoribosylaminoimidazole carboxylase (NCAIR synthetase)
MNVDNRSRWIAVLGGNELNAGFSEYATAHGAKVMVIDWNENPSYAGDRHLRLDIKDTKAVLRALGDLPDRIDFAYTSSDVATETVAQINAGAGLLRCPPQPLALARDKGRMNAVWQAKGLLGKRYVVITEFEDFADAFASWRGPAIVKPADSASSRGISIVETPQSAADLGAIWARAKGASLAGDVVVEDFVRGTEFTAEMIGDSRGHVEVWGISRKYHTVANARNRVATKLHYNPADVARARQERMAAFAADCYRSLGLKAALGHFEFLERPDGSLVPVEIASRSNGFIASHLLPALVGRPGAYLDRYREVLAGGTVSDGLIPAERSSMYFFYDPPLGTWTRNGVSIMEYLPTGIRSLAHQRGRLISGRDVRMIDSDAERLGLEILEGAPSDLTAEAVFAAEARLYGDCVAPARVRA